MLVLASVLLHERVFALVIASSYASKSNIMVLLALPVSPGCCSAVLVPLKQSMDVWQLPVL